jgi:2-methylcitrate dehydratase PrpD
MTSVARRLADFITATGTAGLPAQAMQHAAMVIASTLSSAALGRDIASSRIVRDLARAQGGTPDASVWFDDDAKLPAVLAAKVNTLASDAAASDDSDLRNIIHAGTPATATALAFAEKLGSRGADVLAAIVLGYETAGRIGDAITPDFRDRGFHGCVGAVFAAAVVAARLLKLDAAQTAQAIALAASSIGGLAAAADSSIAREYYAGTAAQLGIEAALAAQRGYEAEEHALEMRLGFFETIGGADPAKASAIALRDLGETFDIVTDLAIKLMPGGHPYHGIAEAAAKAAIEGDVTPENVAAILIWRPGMTALPEPLHPHDLVGMAHSAAYFAAAGVADRGLTWAHATPEKIRDPMIHALIDKVAVGPAPEDDLRRYRQGARVIIQLKNGRNIGARLHAPHGAAALGLAWADIDAKCRALLPAAGMDAARIERVLDVVHDFARLAEVTPLMELLRRSR